MLGLQRFWREIVIGMLVGVIIALLNNNSGLKTENANIESLLLVNKNITDSCMEQIHSRDKKIAMYVKSVDSLDRIISKSESEIVHVNKDKNKKISEVSSYSVSQSAEYFKSRYKTESVSVQSNRLMISDTVSKMCIKDLVSGDYARAELKITASLIKDMKAQSLEKDTIISLLNKQRMTLEDVVSIKDSTISLKDQIILNTQKQLKREARNKKFYKIATIATAAAGGYLLLR